MDIAHRLLACQLNPRADGASLMLATNFHFNQWEWRVAEKDLKETPA